jgi:hypothetical protein
MKKKTRRSSPGGGKSREVYRNECFAVMSDRMTQAPTRFRDTVIRGPAEARAVSVREIRTEEWDDERRIPQTRTWALQRDVSQWPQFTCALPLYQAVYNLTLEEMDLLREPDGTWRTGKRWKGVWTRDASYSTLLSLALYDPATCRTSLRKKMNDWGVIQDTGTGGSWPCSTDRTTWALAAWEVYLATGDRDWLRESYEALARTATVDQEVIRDETTGLLRGESSFLDWREQSYPAWMDAADISHSLCLGTNAVHARTYEILSRMAELLGDGRKDAWAREAAAISRGINQHLWDETAGFYAQFLYGRNGMIRSPSAETLGESLCVLFGIADAERRNRIIESMATTPYGPASFNPQIPGIPPYHNNSIWPFVVAYWTWAAARAGNEAAVIHGLASLIRGTALFLTNKENMTAQTGEKEYLAINSDRQLWSIAGQLAGVCRVLFGMETREDGIALIPLVPTGFGPRLELSGFRYRKGIWDLTVEGEGRRVRSVEIDDSPAKAAFIPAEAEGRHRMRISLDKPGRKTTSSCKMEPAYFAPPSPETALSSRVLQWLPINGATLYRIFCDGQEMTTLQACRYLLPKQADGCAHEWQVQAQNEKGVVSFCSEPVWDIPAKAEILAPLEVGDPLTEGDKIGTPTHTVRLDMESVGGIRVDLDAEGEYLVDFRYTMPAGLNGHDNRCAIRMLYADGRHAGAVLFPQLTQGTGKAWRHSSRVRLALSKGEHRLELRYESACRNMHGEHNATLVSGIRLLRVR